MNHATLLYLLLCLSFATPVLAQVHQLPPSVATHWEEVPPTIRFQLESAGWQIGDPVPEEAVRRSRSRTDTMYLDSTITSVPFGAGGGNAALRPFHRIDFTDVEPRVQSIVSSFYDTITTSWELHSRQLITRDDLGRNIFHTNDFYNDTLDSWQPNTRTFTFPYGTSLTQVDSLTIESLYPDSSEWTHTLTQKNEFDGQNRLVLSRNWLGEGDNLLLFEDRYAYDTAGDNHEIRSYILQDTGEYWATLTEKEYDNHYLTTQTISRFPAPGIRLPIQQFRFSYTPENLVDTFEDHYYGIVKEDWELARREHYEYNEDQQRTDAYTTFYNFAQPGTPSLEAWHHVDYLAGLSYADTEDYYIYDTIADTYVREEHTQHHYRSQATSLWERQLVARPLSVWPNPAAQWVELRLDEPATLRVIDQFGRSLIERRHPPGTGRLSLAALPAGSYYLTATTATGIYLARLLRSGSP
ncbi:hypothetical protein GGR28_001727 [Lewinella aquimaris]|uniref:Secreted protein (Por secretion system target) n=1 Tax=Neolewinella aquimaris TaxID=1835722 RepID=A0A840E1Y5_9BACT|nr:T9SS type A sorting domain-containing protein [Neolewinella aquimaris]MBB4079110.1 hypothetical protein [Neolewinella aquimaris]